MRSNAYQPYIDALRKVLKEDRVIEKSFDSSNRVLNLEQRSAEYQGIVRNVEDQNSISRLAKLLDLPVRQPQTGDHPDFKSVRVNGRPVKHHIISMFMDVRNSTALFRKYDEETVYSAIQIIVLAALQTCSLFGGHIQRMQYDGIFTYFGGRNINRDKAVQNAIKAASFFSYFVKYELGAILEELQVEPLSARTGVDFGNDDDTLWGVLGLGSCTELTTTSLHTSLAPKMQSCAPKNGIIVGRNIRDLLAGDSSYCDSLRDRETGNVDETKRYIYRNPDYAQYNFDWEQYLVDKFRFVNKSGSKIDIDYDANNKDQKSLNSLYSTLGYLGSGTIEKDGTVSNRPSSIPVPQNRNFGFGS